MIEGKPSLTARRVALRRAAHQILDRPRVFEDPLALAIAGVAGNGEAFRDDAREQTRFAKAMRAFMAARSFLAEEALADAFGRGVRQYVVLGAGLNTFAYRNPFGADLQVFEVDFPATQIWKRAQLRTAGIAEPAWLRFVPVDFAIEDAFAALGDAGLDLSQAVWISWLGVSMYLEPATVWATLEAIAGLAPGSGVVFDYAIDPATLAPLVRLVFDEVSRRVTQAGEPWTACFTPVAMTDGLLARGFSTVVDLSGDDINARLFAGREDGLRVGGVGLLVTART